MIDRLGSRGKLIVLALAVGAGGAALAQAGRFVVYNGAVVSHDVRLIGGRPYVPLADMAKALNGSPVRTASGYEIRAGGEVAATVPDTGTSSRPPSGKAGALSGKVGDALYDGKWSLQVLDVKTAGTYTFQQAGGADASKFRRNAFLRGRTVEAELDYSLVLVHCRVKNGQRQAQAFNSGGGARTALIDDQGQSYPPIGWDQNGGPVATLPVSPHAASDITAIFLVPVGTNPQAVVFTLGNVSDPNTHDVRVSLGASGAGAGGGL